MKTLQQKFPELAEIEQEVVAESREWGRRRLAERLQELADRQGEVSPPGSAKAKGADAAKRTGKHSAEG